MRSCIPLIRRKSGSYLSSRRHYDTDDDDDDDGKEVDDDACVNVSAAKRQSASRNSRVTSSCDVITPPSSISDVDDDAVHTAAVVCPGLLWTLYLFLSSCIEKTSLHLATSVCFCDNSYSILTVSSLKDLFYHVNAHLIADFIKDVENLYSP